MQDQHLKSPIISDENNQRIELLFKQIEQIQHIVKSGFWVSTEELAMLLKLENSFIDKLKLEVASQDQKYSFFWRNFECILVERQFAKGFWLITNRQDLLPNTASHNSQKAANIFTVNESQSAANHRGSILLDVSPEEIIPSHYALINEFLSPSQLSELLRYSINKQPEFIPTTNSANDPSYRRSFYLPYFPEFSELMINLVWKITPQILTHLGMSNFAIGQIESQMTAHNHGNYYKIHNDNGSPDTATRSLTYVYYYYREPKAFTGGELVIYDSKIENGFSVAAKSHKVIQPQNKTIIFFP
ncbi:MAG: 2OG-Fe(II) oxygenase, partial [Pseudanabaena sp.]